MRQALRPVIPGRPHGLHVQRRLRDLNGRLPCTNGHKMTGRASLDLTLGGCIRSCTPVSQRASDLTRRLMTGRTTTVCPVTSREFLSGENMT
jgi:hypothetical protein